MAHPTEYGKYNFSKYDTMTTEELDEILRTHFLLADDNAGDERIEYILEVITRREQDKVKANLSDPEPSWEKFLQKHPDIETKASLKKNNESITESMLAKQPAQKTRFLRRIGSIAAIFVCILLVGTVSAYAAGIDLPEILAEWTRETFRFIYATDSGQEERVIPEELEAIYNELSIYAPNQPFPEYFPEGYKLDEKHFDYIGNFRVVSAFLSNGEKNIIIDYVIHFSNDNAVEYEKTDISPDIIIVGDIEYYLFPNLENWVVCWVNGNVEGSIYMQSKDELIKIVESMR